MPLCFVWVIPSNQFNYLNMFGMGLLLKSIKRYTSEDFLLSGGTVHLSRDR